MVKPAGGMVNWTSHASTHRGNIRKVNQDAYLARDDIGLWAVADGMGGHSRGERASEVVIETLVGLPQPRLLGRSAGQLGFLISVANKRLIEEAYAAGEEIIGSTIVALLAVDKGCVLMWVGDSRGYLLRDGELHQISVDHTESERSHAHGGVLPAGVQGSVLTRAVGAEDDVRVDRIVRVLRPGDRYLLCSDGLSKELSKVDMQRLLLDSSPEVAVRELTTAALRGGGRDNITAVVIDFFADPENR